MQKICAETFSWTHSRNTSQSYLLSLPLIGHVGRLQKGTAVVWNYTIILPAEPFYWQLILQLWPVCALRFVWVMKCEVNVSLEEPCHSHRETTLLLWKFYIGPLTTLRGNAWKETVVSGTISKRRRTLKRNYKHRQTLYCIFTTFILLVYFDNNNDGIKEKFPSYKFQ